VSTTKRTFAQAARLARHGGTFADSVERLTPVASDLPSVLPLAATFVRLMASPGPATSVAASAVAGYSVTSAAVDAVRASLGGSVPVADAIESE